jgi:hypothetical protein
LRLKINSGPHAPTRSMLDSLIRKRYGQEFNLFWNSYLKQLQEISNKRNEIVHWVTATNIGNLDADGRPIVTLSLIPPNFLHSVVPSPEITIQGLNDFQVKCDVYARLCNIFCVFRSGKVSKEQSAIYDGVFQEPMIYPLPDSHPMMARKP